MENFFVTITGLNHYYGKKPFTVGRIVKLVKEPENRFDHEAIRVELPFIDTIGYVANSIDTVFDGTFSSGRIFDKIDEFGFAQVMFITHSSVIALYIPKKDVKTEAPGAVGFCTDKPTESEGEAITKNTAIGF